MTSGRRGYNLVKITLEGTPEEAERSLALALAIVTQEGSSHPECTGGHLTSRIWPYEFRFPRALDSVEIYTITERLLALHPKEFGFERRE